MTSWYLKLPPPPPTFLISARRSSSLRLNTPLTRCNFSPTHTPSDLPLGYIPEAFFFSLSFIFSPLILEPLKFWAGLPPPQNRRRSLFFPPWRVMSLIIFSTQSSSDRFSPFPPPQSPWKMLAFYLGYKITPVPVNPFPLASAPFFSGMSPPLRVLNSPPPKPKSVFPAGSFMVRSS